MNGDRSSEPIQFKWEYEIVKVDPTDSNLATGEKMYGDMEINNIKIFASSSSITKEEEAKGVQWKGNITLDYLFRAKSNQILFGSPDHELNTDRVNELMTNFSESLPYFGEWLGWTGV